jgi:hypothetical protein
MAHKDGARLSDPFGRDFERFGKGHDEPFIAQDVLKYPGEEFGLTRGGPNGCGIEAGKRQKQPESFRLPGQVFECLNCQLQRRFLGDSINFPHLSMFPIP